MVGSTSDTTFHATVGDPAWLTRTCPARAKPLTLASCEKVPSGLDTAATAWDRLRSRIVNVTRSPQAPSVDARTRQAGPAVVGTRTDAASAPTASSRDATRTTQQRTPPFSKNPRTA